MALSAPQYQQLLVQQLGQTNTDGFAETVALLWELYDGKPLGLRFQYAKRDAIDALLGQRWEDHDIKEATASESLSQVPKNLHELRKTVVEEIERLEKLAVAARAGGAVAPMVARAPLEVDPLVQPDPNGRVYRGDAVVNRPRGWS